MLTQLQPLRTALISAITELNIPVFAQRKINEEDIASDRFVALTLARSDSEDDGYQPNWNVSMILGVYIENPATDELLEQLANDVAEKIRINSSVQALVTGVLFDGHEYPEEQGDTFASLDVRYTITFN